MKGNYTLINCLDAGNITSTCKTSRLARYVSVCSEVVLSDLYIVLVCQLHKIKIYLHAIMLVLNKTDVKTSKNQPGRMTGW